MRARSHPVKRVIPKHILLVVGVCVGLLLAACNSAVPWADAERAVKRQTSDDCSHVFPAREDAGRAKRTGRGLRAPEIGAVTGQTLRDQPRDRLGQDVLSWLRDAIETIVGLIVRLIRGVFELIINVLGSIASWVVEQLGRLLNNCLGGLGAPLAALRPTLRWVRRRVRR
jgi:hypothetical protein